MSLILVYRSSAGSEECCCVPLAISKQPCLLREGLIEGQPCDHIVEPPAILIASLDAPSVSRCRSVYLPTLRGNRNELHESGSLLAFVMPRDAEPLAHRWFAGPARGASTVLRPGCRFVSKQTLVSWSASSPKRTQERMNDSRKLANCDAEQLWQGRTTEQSIWLTSASGRWE